MTAAAAWRKQERRVCIAIVPVQQSASQNANCDHTEVKTRAGLALKRFRRHVQWEARFEPTVVAVIVITFAEELDCCKQMNR